MSDIKLSLKVQHGDKVKRLLEKEYAALSELKEVIQNSFKNLEGSNFVLKYMDNEGDWLYIFDDSDLAALKEYYVEGASKSIKLVVESQEELAQSTCEPKRFFESQIKDSCVAEVEAYLASQKSKEEEKNDFEESEMDVEIIESQPDQVISPEEEHIKEVNQIQDQLESARLTETQPESENQEMHIDPVVVEEPSNQSQQPHVDAVIEEEEIIDTSSKHEEENKQEQPKEELRPFNIMELLQNVQDALNKDEKDFRPKDVFCAAKSAIKGTTAEKNCRKACKKFKEGKGFFFKKMMQGLMNGTFCQQQNPNRSNVIHRGITCDGCNARPVVGVRYKCSECPDFDLCEDCEAKDVHNHHVFLKLKHPMGVDIIYSQRTNEDGTQNIPQQPPQQPPHHAPFQNPWGNPFGGMRGPWGPPHHHPHGGPRGGRGRCHRNWENNPLMQLARQFLGGMEEDKDSSDSPNRRDRPQGGWAPKRPVVVKKPDGALIGTVGGMQVVETTIQNQSPFPYRLKSVKMLEADEGLIFQEIETDVQLKKDEMQDFCLAVQLPEKPGTYKARFGFFNAKGLNHGDQLEVVFEVVQE